MRPAKTNPLHLPCKAGELRVFLVEFAEHDWRKSASVLPSYATVGKTLDAHVVHETVGRRLAFISAEEIVGALLVTCGEAASVLHMQRLADRLLVLQVNAVVRGLVSKELANFDCSSVPDGLFWRKNASKTWSSQCLPNRYGWFSDSISIRDLLTKILHNGSAVAFCETMGFSRVSGCKNGGYGDMYFMFFTQRQLQELEAVGVEFFQPLWPEAARRLRSLFDRRVAEGALDKWVPSMWDSTDIGAWEEALATFERVSATLDTPQARLHFLEFSIKACKPMWDQEWVMGTCSPRWHPVAAARHLLDQWFGANHLFMGDGKTWSETRVQGHNEFLVSSFENLDLDRVSIFPDQ